MRCAYCVDNEENLNCEMVEFHFENDINVDSYSYFHLQSWYPSLLLVHSVAFGGSRP